MQERIDKLRRSAEGIAQGAYRAPNATQRKEEFLLADKLNKEADELEKGLRNGVTD